jgi:hypothetical protein
LSAADLLSVTGTAGLVISIYQRKYKYADKKIKGGNEGIGCKL